MSKSILEQFGEAIQPIVDRSEESPQGIVVSDWVNERIEVAKKALQDNDKNTARRSLYQSIVALPIVEEDGVITVQVEANDYWDFVNSGVDGTKIKRGAPYSYDGKQPPVTTIRQWMYDRSITTREYIDKTGAKQIQPLTTEEERNALAFGIARSIKIKGVEANPFMDIAFSDEAVEDLTERLKQVL